MLADPAFCWAEVDGEEEEEGLTSSLVGEGSGDDGPEPSDPFVVDASFRSSFPRSVSITT